MNGNEIGRLIILETEMKFIKKLLYAIIVLLSVQLGVNII